MSIENNTKISIAIPTYEMGGYGHDFLQHSFNKILTQTYKNIEVVISDHSIGDEIRNLCESYKNLNIVYIKNENDRGNFSANLNNVIKYCSGDIIKLLMQDDYLFNNSSIQKIVECFNDNPEKIWLAVGSVFGYSEDNLHHMFPKYSPEIVNCVNSIGSPSVIAFKKDHIQFFDENLQWVMDLDFYKRMYDKFGEPLIIEKYLVFVRQHANQISITFADHKKLAEENLLRERYKN